MKKWIALVLVVGASLFLITSAQGATGEEERGRVDAQGLCDNGSMWILTMEPEVGIKFEATIETNAPGQQWHITLAYFRHVLIDEIKVTEDDGGFEVVTVESNARGSDITSVHAVNLDTGEICWGKLRAEI
jgi:hypothetical protein